MGCCMSGEANAIESDVPPPEWGAPLKVGSSVPGAPDNLLLLDTEGLQSISQTEGCAVHPR